MVVSFGNEFAFAGGDEIAELVEDVWGVFFGLFQGHTGDR